MDEPVYQKLTQAEYDALESAFKAESAAIVAFDYHALKEALHRVEKDDALRKLLAARQSIRSMQNSIARTYGFGDKPFTVRPDGTLVPGIEPGSASLP